mmetsp:Transcript_42486/g.91250  ORF Transcript_42486/g.91250 Transcript_42486/m.91250 type:complete len:203 (-) Transcript_42486:1460-2068(-)
MQTIRLPNASKPSHIDAKPLFSAGKLGARATPEEDGEGWLRELLWCTSLSEDGLKASAALSAGSQKPRRWLSKSKMDTKCSKKTPPSTHKSAVGSSIIGMSIPPKACRRRRCSNSFGFWQRVVCFFSLPCSQTLVCVQTDPSGRFSISSSISSPAPARPNGFPASASPLLLPSEALGPPKPRRPGMEKGKPGIPPDSPCCCG